MIENLKLHFSRSIPTYNEAAIVQRKMAMSLIQDILSTDRVYNHVYEMGAGTGLLTQLICEELNAASVIVNDLSPEMRTPLSELLGRFTGLNWSFVAGNAEYLPVPADSDLIVSNAVVQWFNNLPAFLKRLTNEMKENSTIAFSSFGKNNVHECATILGTGISYNSLEEVEETSRSFFNVHVVREESITLWFDNPYDILRHMKHTGVNVFGSAQSKSGTATLRNRMWTKKHLHDFCHAFKEQFETDGKVPLTYHPLFVVGTKQAG